MADVLGDGDGARRIGDVEREAAVAALDAHREAGRLDPTEFEDRQVRVSRARTWADVRPLFVDLPQPHPVGMPPTDGTAPLRPGAAPRAGRGQEVERRGDGLLGAVVPERYRATVTALTPFVALVLFFATDLWEWFLLIPVVAVLLYGSERHSAQEIEAERIERQAKADRRALREQERLRRRQERDLRRRDR